MLLPAYVILKVGTQARNQVPSNALKCASGLYANFVVEFL